MKDFLIKFATNLFGAILFIVAIMFIALITVGPVLLAAWLIPHSAFNFTLWAIGSTMWAVVLVAAVLSIKD